jgi:hypothetical protein
MTVREILTIVGELGFVDIRKDGSIIITTPTKNVHKQRLELFGKIIFEYKKRKPDLIFKGFFTLYDSWREHAEPSEQPDFFRPNRKTLRMFVGKGTLGEPGRFIQSFPLKDQFPVFDYPVLSFGRHKNDPFTIMLPDTDFIESEGYLNLRDEIDRDDCLWNEKVPKLYWRGSSHGFAYKVYDQQQIRSQRSLLLEWSKGYQNCSDVLISKYVSKSEQLKHKYLLDVDGEVNAWSGLFWKLYCKSVVFKVNSHYEQWYYPRLKPFQHYIPVAGDLSDLEEKYNWAVANDDICCQIAQSGRVLASSLTFKNELDNLNITNENKELFARYSVKCNASFELPKLSNLTVVHTYRQNCTTIQQSPGFGDFLRGTITLYELSIKYGFKLNLDFSFHSLYDLLKQHYNADGLDKLPVYEFFNQKNCELESFVVGQSELGKICLITHAVPNQDITRSCRQFLIRRLRPTKKLSSYISAIADELELSGYCTVHIRMGDNQFNSELTLPSRLENWFVEEVLSIWGTNVLVLSDNISIKRILKEKFDIKIIKVKPVHLGQLPMCKASKDEVRDTFTEFHLMSRSSWIYQYSVYPWGSSFSEICAKIYDIPFEKQVNR